MGVITICAEEFQYDSQDEEKYIISRLASRQEGNIIENLDLAEAVRQSIDAAGEFLEIMDNSNQVGYSTDDEMEYIIKKTGLNSSFVELLIWYKMCYEMELDMYQYVGESCLECGGSQLFEKEIPMEDYGTKIVCRECGTEMVIDETDELEKMEQFEEKRSKELAVLYDENLALIRDFDTFVKFVDSNNPLLSKKKQELGKKEAFTLNSLLNFKREVDAPNYRQEQYYCLHLLFQLSLAGGLYRKVIDESEKMYLQRTELLDSFEQLNAYEKYVFLLETYWCKYDFANIFSHSLPYDVYLLRNFLITIAQSEPGKRIENNPEVKDKYIDRCFSNYFEIILHLSYFGMCTFEFVKEATNRYEDRIRAFTPTKFGQKISYILITEGMEYFKHAKYFHNLNHTLTKKENEPTNTLTFYQIISEIFPYGAVIKTVLDTLKKK